MLARFPFQFALAIRSDQNTLPRGHNSGVNYKLSSYKLTVRAGAGSGVTGAVCRSSAAAYTLASRFGAHKEAYKRSRHFVGAVLACELDLRLRLNWSSHFTSRAIVAGSSESDACCRCSRIVDVHARVSRPQTCRNRLPLIKSAVKLFVSQIGAFQSALSITLPIIASKRRHSIPSRPLPGTDRAAR